MSPGQIHLLLPKTVFKLCYVYACVRLEFKTFNNLTGLITGSGLGVKNGLTSFTEAFKLCCSDSICFLASGVTKKRQAWTENMLECEKYFLCKNQLTRNSFVVAIISSLSPNSQFLISQNFFQVDGFRGGLTTCISFRTSSRVFGCIPNKWTIQSTKPVHDFVDSRWKVPACYHMTIKSKNSMYCASLST